MMIGVQKTRKEKKIEKKKIFLISYFLPSLAITDRADINKVDTNRVVGTSKVDINKVVIDKEPTNRITINKVVVDIHRIADINKAELVTLMLLIVILQDISKLVILPTLIIPRHNNKLLIKIRQMIMFRTLLVVILVPIHME